MSANPFIWLQHIAPQHGLSKLAGSFAESRTPWIRDRLIRRFIAAYDVDMAEAKEPEGSFETFNAFFTRELKPGARPLADSDQFVLSPADGAISQLGRIENGRILQAKGHDYTAAELLGGDAALAERFANGQFATIYLSPRDYHRVHMPVAGQLRSTCYVPGDLYSVNGATAQGVPRLFARNERLACLFDSECGIMASVMVGAMIVAGIETVWGGRVPPHGNKLFRQEFPAVGPDARSYAAGDEMGRFLLGSTVILLFGDGKVEFAPELVEGSPVRMGQALARKL
ncbi:archaetidylserine decarboxylase [Parerythrobacter jejuensis]|uniref:Phosphatidylserine decarboxylase proenzyme n=1 Tax=Parerythrobacter jejuensis TaxID=795812 RepID=A0A845ANZ1_9SPHN|nr:archaetidylserine decarboxylase [Parerythrobacter jejuensis]MXP31147.1 phosphatidylserine decarboxylase [Parerythrobacter jejuensis]MXP33907.1 phosphatidylserine decarboxylase [Parerythrobacter jejuensis]